MTGKVKWFSDMCGYGFIVHPETGEDVFVHFGAIEMDGYKTLTEGQTVEFEVEETPRGRAARNVRMAQETQEA